MGETAFFIRLSGTGITSANDGGIASDAGGSVVQPIAMEGMQVAGLAAGVTYRSFGIPQLNDSGQFGFVSLITGPGITSSNDSGAFNDLAPVQLESDQVGSLGTGVTNSGVIGGPAMNNSGRVAFWSFLAGPGITSENNQAIISDLGGVRYSSPLPSAVRRPRDFPRE